MDETQMEELKRALAVIAENVAAAVDGIKAAIDALQVADIFGGCESLEDAQDSFAALLRGFSEAEVTDYLSTLVEEVASIPPPTKKPPRPPKRTGPVNKANYTANRPPRVARSSCRTIKR